MRIKAFMTVLLAALFGLSAITVTQAVAVAPPAGGTPPGISIPNPAPGETKTVHLPRKLTPKEIKEGWDDTVTVHGLTQVEIAALHIPAAASTAPAASAPTSGLKSSYRARYVQACWTFTSKSGFSLLWAKMSQTWCGSSSPYTLIYYWPAASCWGYSASWTPSYHYEGCSTSQLYGLYWAQGRTTWDASTCDAYTATFCWSRTYIHQQWTFTNLGSYWQSG